MKSFLSIAVLLAAICPIAPVAQAQVLVGFAQNDASLTLALDIYGNAQTVDAATGAALTYSRKGVMYAAIPGVNGFARIAPLLERSLPEARVERMGEGPILMGYPTDSWRLLVNRKPCGQFFTSPTLAKVLQFNITDIARLNVAMGMLAVDDLKAKPCTYYDMPRALGNMIGFPLAFEGVAESTNVTNIDQGGKVIYDMPPKALQKPYNAAMQRSYLRQVLPADVIKVFDQNRPDLTPEQEVDALKRLRAVQPQ